MTQALAKTITDKGTLEGLMANGTFQESLKTVLPQHLTPERVVKMALVAASRQPLLFKCTKESFLQAIMKAAELGIDCSGTLGRGYLIPYYNSKLSAYEAQFLVGYQGLIELARRSGNIARIESRVVYEKDKFTVEYGLDQKLIHTPLLASDRGQMQCVYAIAEMTDGSRQLEVMTISEVESIRNRSKAKDSGPWKTDYAEMARKTVIRRLAKYLPLSTELQKAFEADDEQFTNGHFIDNAGEMAERTKGKVVALREQFESQAESQSPPEPEPEHIDGEIIEPSTTDADEPTSEESQLADLITLAKDKLSEITKGGVRKTAEILNGRILDNMNIKQVNEFLEELEQRSE